MLQNKNSQMVLVHQINGNKWGHWFGDQQGSAGDLLWCFIFLKPNSKNKTSGSCSGDGVERKGLHIKSKVWELYRGLCILKSMLESASNLPQYHKLSGIPTLQNWVPSPKNNLLRSMPVCCGPKSTGGKTESNKNCRNKKKQKRMDG